MPYSRAALKLDVHEELCHLRDMVNPPRIYTICTGAGSQLQSTLWAVPGASKYMVGSMMPYDTASTDHLLGFTPAKYVHPMTAVDLAQRAYQEAVRSKRPGKAVGIGLTASVASQEVHRGDHAVYVAGMTKDKCVVLTMQLPKGVGDEDREQDDLLCEAVAFKVLFQLLSGCGVRDKINHRDVACTQAFHDADAANRSLFFGKPFFQSDGRRLEAPEDGNNMILLPGTFNPLHFGHKGMEEELARMGEHVVFTIEAGPPHKAALSVGEMLERANQFTGRNVLFTEGLPLYIDKAREFPGAGIAMGADSLERMLDPKWGPDPGMLLAEFKKLGCQLYVFDRTVKGVRNTGLKALDKAGLRHYGVSGGITCMPEEWSEISSSILRNQNDAR